MPFRGYKKEGKSENRVCQLAGSLERGQLRCLGGGGFPPCAVYSLYSPSHLKCILGDTRCEIRREEASLSPYRPRVSKLFCLTQVLPQAS